jgi:hypothetical protein
MEEPWTAVDYGDDEEDGDATGSVEEDSTAAAKVANELKIFVGACLQRNWSRGVCVECDPSCR